MPVCETKYFGQLSYSDNAALEFPRGLPGFEQERQFVVIEHAPTQPLVYIQSLSDPGLCFVAIPLYSITPDYQLELTDEDRASIGIGRGAQAISSPDLLCLALVSLRETGATANLMAPVVASLSSRKAVQAISGTGRYSHQHALSTFVGA